MSPQRKTKSTRRGTGWKPPRDRREVVVAVLAALAVIVVTFALVWFTRPNRDSGSSPSTGTVTTTPAASTPATTTAPPATAPAATSTP